MPHVEVPGVLLPQDGVKQIESLTREQAGEILAFLETKPKLQGHIEGQPSASQTCWSMADVLTAPHVLETAIRWTPTAGAYLEAEPLLYSVNAFTMYPSAGLTSRDTQEFHRDKDDTKFLALFVYLTDVLIEEDGAHQYLKGTHRGTNQGELETITGPAGTMFLSDGRGFHRGIRPTTHPRTILWIRWGVSDPPASYKWCGLKPVDRAWVGERYPSDPQIRKQIRLVVA